MEASRRHAFQKPTTGITTMKTLTSLLAGAAVCLLASVPVAAHAHDQVSACTLLCVSGTHCVVQGGHPQCVPSGPGQCPPSVCPAGTACPLVCMGGGPLLPGVR